MNCQIHSEGDLLIVKGRPTKPPNLHSTAASVGMGLQNASIPYRKKAELVLGGSTSKGLTVYTATSVRPKLTDVAV